MMNSLAKTKPAVQMLWQRIKKWDKQCVKAVGWHTIFLGRQNTHIPIRFPATKDIYKNIVGG